jgi:hypothetical protein
MKITQIVIKGERQVIIPAKSPGDSIELKESFLIMGAARGVTQSHTLNLRDNNLVELVFEDNTTWFCNADTLEEVFPEATVQKRTAGGAFEIPAVLQSIDSERGIVGNILLKALNIFTKKAVGKEVRKLAEDLEKKQLENYSGLYRLDDHFGLHDFSNESTDKPFLLFLHGTSSSTKGSFSELSGSEAWNYIQQTYGNNVLAFQHETLTKSPLQNALELVEKLPKNITLHIISHSRGGLVGDILSRFCNSNENNRGFNSDEISYLKKSNRTEDISQINSLKKELQSRKITISKFIRVACPAGGTILASKRLDNFLNISFNLIGFGAGLAATPACLAFRSLIAAAIDAKNDATLLPGLEAMNPESPFIKVLNSPATDIVIGDPLAIISGNCKTKINLKALLIIASKLFYHQDNDLVVNTSSMYQGTKRTGTVQFFFDETTGVDHFHYFKNKETSDAIRSALKAAGGEAIPGFSSLRKGSVAEGERNAILKLDGGQVFKNIVTGTKPILVLLPGIMGSNLTRGGKLVWINYLRFLAGELTTLDIKTNGIIASSLIRTSYKKIVDYFSETYDVVTFPFDWRLQLNESAAEFNNAITKLLNKKQPIKIVGHSMGGVLVRDFIINYPGTWKTLNQSSGFRLLFLGAPLGGSFRIPYVLFGKDAIIDKLSKIDILHTKKDLLKVFAKMPGILSLLPLTIDTDNDFSSLTATWKKMSEPLGDWPLPQANDLKEFQNYRDAILKGFESIDYSNTIYIAGKDKATPCGYRVDDTTAGKELVFLSTAEGDQSVTWESGIPKKLIENNSVYYVNVSHGGLANEPEIFKGIAEILSGGATSLLSKTRPSVRGIEKLFRTPEPEVFDISSEGVEKTILGLEDPAKEKITGETPIRVYISNGDLHYASYPVLAGHFLGDGILYAEKAIDRYLKKALSERNKFSIYPGEIGSSEIFISTEKDFTGAVIVGLGPIGMLTAYELSRTTEQGILKYLLDVNINAGQIGISSLIVGCGFGGLSVESSVTAIIQGVQNANEKIKKLHPENAITIKYIEFIELYEDTALNCLYALNKIEKKDDRSLNIVIDPKRIRVLLGSKRRLLGDTSEKWWKRLTVKQVNEPKSPEGINCLLFDVSTGGAREEQRKLYSSTPIVSQLIEDLSTNNNWSPSLARTIFELLIPNDFKEQLKKQSNTSWILDKFTAAYPWELLEDTNAGAEPLCVSAGMIRQLITQDFRLKINAVTELNALVMGDPDLQGSNIPQLPGAEKEARLVADMLADPGRDSKYEVTPSFNDPAPVIIEKLFKSDYKIIHLAGHGFFNQDAPENSGMVIGDKIYLSTREIAQMSRVPELVFVNCCFLGKTDGVAEAYYRGRYQLAANIGTQLIEIGVKAVVVAGWAVDDGAAFDFARIFYKYMFDGISFGDAVKEARKYIYNNYRQTNTWGAYQCYGDPFYTFRGEQKSSDTDQPYVMEQEAEIDLYNLRNELDTGGYTHQEYLEWLSAISQKVDRAGLRNAPITELEAFIYAESGEYDLAISKFESLFVMEKASFSIAALERYCNIRAKKYMLEYVQSGKNQRAVFTKINKVIKDLENLITISPTAERYTLLASAYKRKGFLSSTRQQKIESIAEAAFYYMRSDSVRGNLYKEYSVTNWYEMETILVLSGKRKWGQAIKTAGGSYKLPMIEDMISHLATMEIALVNLQNNSVENMDYWNMIGIANIKLCQSVISLSDTKNKIAWEDILNAYRQVWVKAGARGKKIAEIEHLQLLSDELAFSKKQNVTELRKNIEQLKNELEKMIGS